MRYYTSTTDARKGYLTLLCMRCGNEFHSHSIQEHCTSCRLSDIQHFGRPFPAGQFSGG